MTSSVCFNSGCVNAAKWRGLVTSTKSLRDRNTSILRGGLARSGIGINLAEMGLNGEQRIRLAGSDGSEVNRFVAHIKTQVRLASRAVGAVTGEAVLGQNGPNVAVVLHRLSAPNMW